MVRIFNILKESYAHLHLFIYYYIYSLKITVKKVILWNIIT